MIQPLLMSQDLSFERNNKFIFHSFNFTLNHGEALHVLGENGCGKSTLLRMLAGLIEPQQGRILWQNEPIHLLSYQQQLHYIGHHNGIKPALTVLENIKLYCALLAKKPSSSQLSDYLQILNLHSVIHSPAAHLSAGQLRRLALIKLFLKPATLWILDEPTTALDISGQELLTRLLNQHLACGNCAIIATHHDIQHLGNKQTINLGVSA